MDEAELLEAMLDGTAAEADIDVSKAGFARPPPPLPTQSSMTPTPKPAATSSAKPWQKLTYLDENDANQKVKSLVEAQQLVNQGVLGPETLGACQPILACSGSPVWSIDLHLGLHGAVVMPMPRD